MSQESIKEYIDEATKIIMCKIEKKNSEEEIQKMIDKIQPLYDAMDEEEKMYVDETILRLEIWKMAEKKIKKSEKGNLVKGVVDRGVE